MSSDDPSAARRARAAARPPAAAGFSLIEVMIVLVIIAVMAGTVTVAVRHRVDAARQTRVRQDLLAYANAAETFYSEVGRYPTNDEGLAALAPRYLKKVVNDPWGRPYQYNAPGRAGPFEVVCLGADGRKGGDGADQDLTSDAAEQAPAVGKASR